MYNAFKCTGTKIGWAQGRGKGPGAPGRGCWLVAAASCLSAGQEGGPRPAARLGCGHATRPACLARRQLAGVIKEAGYSVRQWWPIALLTYGGGGGGAGGQG